MLRLLPPGYQTRPLSDQLPTLFDLLLKPLVCMISLHLVEGGPEVCSARCCGDRGRQDGDKIHRHHGECARTGGTSIDPERDLQLSGP